MLKKTLTMAMAIGMSLGTGSAAWGSALDDVMKARGLTQKDLLAAAKTYTPSGGRDEYIAFSSGGQSGQLIVYGIPSMRILKYVAVFTPEPWQGYGFDDESKAVLAQGRINGKDILFGDTHHPAISETNAEYDGQYLFINDKNKDRVNPEGLDLLSKMLVYDKNKRITPTEAMKHAYFEPIRELIE